MDGGEMSLRFLMFILCVGLSRGALVHAEGQSPAEALANVSAKVVNGYLGAPTACHFYASASSSVEAGTVTENTRTHIVDDASGLLQACNQVLSDVGEKGCTTIELAGHSLFESMSLGTVIGVDTHPGYIAVYPDDPELFGQITQCFQSLTKSDAPVIYTTCGGVRHNGVIVPYPGRAQAQALLADAFQRRVVSATGPCSADGAGAYCVSGWYQVDPTPSAQFPSRGQEQPDPLAP